MLLPFSYSDCSRKQFVTFHFIYSCNTAAISTEDAIHLLTSSILTESFGVGAYRGLHFKKIRYQHLVTNVLFSLHKRNIWIRKSLSLTQYMFLTN